MSENVESDAVLFWLEQEPVETSADIYLPPDTPTHIPTSKVLFQIKKKQDLKKTRTIERLKAFHYQKLAELRKNYAQELKKNNSPKKRKYEQYLESVNSGEFLQEKAAEIVKLFGEINKLNSKDKDSTLLQDIASEEKERQKRIKAAALTVKEQEDEYDNISAAELQLYNTESSTLFTQYNKTVSLIQQKKENEQPRQNQSSSPIETAPLPPLPPRVSRTDPRERFLEEYPPISH